VGARHIPAGCLQLLPLRFGLLVYHQELLPGWADELLGGCRGVSSPEVLSGLPLPREQYCGHRLFSVLIENDCRMQPLTCRLPRRNVGAVVGGGRTYGADRSVAYFLISMIPIIVAQAYPRLCFGWTLPVGWARVSCQRPPPPIIFWIRRTRHSTGILPGQKCESSPGTQSPLTKELLWQALWLSNALLHRSVVIKLGGRSFRLRDHHAASETVRRTSSGIRRPMQSSRPSGWGLSTSSCRRLSGVGPEVTGSAPAQR
jgi:hypothetical protein